MAVELAEWIKRLREEYLEEFIPSGGAAVKIAVAPMEWGDHVMESLSQEALGRHYVTAAVRSASVRVHMIDQVFFAVTRGIDWDAAVDRWLRIVLRENGIRVGEDQSPGEVDAIAEANGRSRPDLIAEINRLVANTMSQNYSLAREFRTAVTLLCLGRINPQNVSPTDADVVKQWLLGERCSLATLKRLQIYSRINRNNARVLLTSLAVWLHQAGYAGLALLLDLNAVLLPSPPPENLVRYTRSSTLDTFEVIRQFIDDTDEASYLLVGVVAGPGLIEDPKRSIDNYTALKLRLVDDVRDQQRSNPLNAMVRLGNAGGSES